MDFIKHIEKNVGKEAIIDFQPKHPADTQATWSDTTKLQALGYKPSVSIGEGIEKFVKWYKEYYNV
jgi:UDP-glucuronate 4-epimerase